MISERAEIAMLHYSFILRTFQFFCPGFVNLSLLLISSQFATISNARILNENCIVAIVPDILGVIRARRIHWQIVNGWVTEWEEVTSMHLIALARLLNNNDGILLEILGSLGLVLYVLRNGSFNVKTSAGILHDAICSWSKEDAVLKFIIKKKAIAGLIGLVGELTWKTSGGYPFNCPGCREVVEGAHQR
jgi:hypothetical protein